MRASLSISDALSGQGLRQPLLKSVRHIDSIRDLVPFFSSVSIMAYEAVYASDGAISWDAVEQGFVDDIFDNR